MKEIKMNIVRFSESDVIATSFAFSNLGDSNQSNNKFNGYLVKANNNATYANIKTAIEATYPGVKNVEINGSTVFELGDLTVGPYSNTITLSKIVGSYFKDGSAVGVLNGVQFRYDVNNKKFIRLQ